MTRTLKQQPKHTLNVYFYQKYNNLGETRTHLPLFQQGFSFSQTAKRLRPRKLAFLLYSSDPAS